MGVRGLTTYVNNNQDVFMKRYYLQNTKLIIDGHSLCVQIYRSLNNFSAFGGNYDKFALSTATFFKNLHKCKITPHVVFDGCHETKKLKTVFKRLTSKLINTSRLDPVTQDNLQTLPFLLRDVFRKVLCDMKINYAICKFEADNNIASLARHMNCPVLSYDSDFFIYNVLYIPLYTLHYKPISIEENGVNVYVMKCKIYKVQYLCEHFGDLSEKLLPLLATVLGNDYVEKKVFQKFFSQLKLFKSKKKKTEHQRSIHTLFNWLKNETLDSAIAKILGRLKKHQRKRVLAIIKKSVETYNSNNFQALKYFNTSEVNVGEIVKGSQEREKIISDEKFKLMPAWFVEKIRCKKVPISYLNLYVHHLQICNPQAEDFTKQDCFLCTLPILRYAFDILTDFSYDNCVYVCRENYGYNKLRVGREYSIPRPFDESFKEMNDEQLKLCFQYFLYFKLPSIDLSLIEILPSNFRLFMISLLWWISTCSVPDAHVHSLIMSYITLEVIDEKTGTARGHYHFNNRHAKKLEELKKTEPTYKAVEDELFLSKNKVQYEDCLIAASVILKLFEIDDSILKRPKSYDINKIHSFAQFQCVLHQINSLNMLCCSPFESTTFSRSYNGMLIYNIALKLEKHADPIIFFDNYIKGATTVLLFYKSIYSIYKKLLKKMFLSTVPWSKTKKQM